MLYKIKIFIYRSLIMHQIVDLKYYSFKVNFAPTEIDLVVRLVYFVLEICVKLLFTAATMMNIIIRRETETLINGFNHINYS